MYTCQLACLFIFNEVTWFFPGKFLFMWINEPCDIIHTMKKTDTGWMRFVYLFLLMLHYLLEGIPKLLREIRFSLTETLKKFSFLPTDRACFTASFYTIWSIFNHYNDNEISTRTIFVQNLPVELHDHRCDNLHFTSLLFNTLYGKNNYKKIR